MKAWFRFMDWTLRAKMAALLVVASLVPLGIETWVDIRAARTRLLENTADLLAARGDQLAGQLDTFHRGYQRSLDGGARLFATVPWTVLDMIPEQTRLAEIAQMTRQKTLFAVAVILLALLAGSRFAARILKPVGARATVTDRLAEGALAARVPAGSADELGRLAEMVRGMSEGCFMLDAEWRFTFVNQRSETIFHKRREEMLGRSIWEVFPQLIGAPMEPHYRRAMATRTAAAFEVFSNVAQRWLDVRLFPTGDGLAAFLLDITDRRRTEGRFRRLVDSNAQGVIFWNTKGKITGANEAFLRIVGYSREDLEAGRIGWAAMTPPEHTHLDTRALEELAATGVCTPLEKEYIRKDGSRVPILLGAAVFEDSPEEGVCFVLDITGRKRTEQALRESEEHFRFLNDLGEATRTLADPAQIMAVTAGMLGQHLRVSRCAYADMEENGEGFTILHDYTDGCASTVGHYELSLFGPRAVATLHRGETLILRDVAAELLPGEGAEMFQAIGIEAIITCPLVKEGALRAMMAVHQATPRDWQPGEIALVQDVVERCWATIERRRAEEKIHQLNATLEQRVIERTAQLEVANKELEAFSYSVSHDLRAPLRAVDGFSRVVEEDYGAHLPAEGRRYLQTIREGAQRMGILIDDLLTFSRLSRLPLTRQPVDVQRLVRRALDEQMSGQDGRAIEIKMDGLPPCEGDPTLLKQVWANLLSNALKYTAKRPRAVIEIGSTRENTATVYFVRDNGTGFDMRYAAKLFGVFQRLHRQEEFDGTGVGLAIVQRIVHRHGGRVWAEAAVDRGATFYFTLEEETKP